MGMPEEVRAAADALLDAIRQTETYERYARAKELAMAEETNRALLRRFAQAQTALQMAALAGTEANEADASAFEKLSSLLYASPECADYLLAQMAVQQMVGGVLERVTQGADIAVSLPE